MNAKINLKDINEAGFSYTKRFLFIGNNTEILCKKCQIAMQEKERFILCGNLDGVAYHVKCYSDDHAKNWISHGQSKQHFDYVMILRIVPTAELPTLPGEEYNFVALKSIVSSHPQETP